MTQPAVTHHVKSLERSSGVKLLDIRRKRVYLTKAGETLFPHAAEIYEQAIEAEISLQNLKEASLRIGVALTFSPIVTSAATTFGELYPHVELSIKNGPSFEIAQEVLNLQLDLAVVASMDYGSPKLEHTTISAEEKLVLVAPSSSPICQKEQVELSDLCDYPLVMGPEGSATRQIILNKFAADGLKAKSPIAVEINDVECGKSIVADGRGIAIFALSSVEEEVAQGRLKILPFVDDLRIGVDVIVHRDVCLSLPGERFTSLVREAFQRHCYHCFHSS